MQIPDTDHLTLVERGGSAALSLQLRLNQVPISEIGTTVVNYEAYALLEEHIATFQDLAILSFDAKAADQYGDLLQARVRIGTSDLRQRFRIW